MYNKFSDKLLQHGLGRQFQKVNIQAYLQNCLNELGLNGIVQVLDNRPAMYRQFFKNRGDINQLIHQYDLEIVMHTIDACDKLAAYLVETHHIGHDKIFDNIRKPLPGGNQSLTLLYDYDHNHIKVTLLTRRMQKAARLGIIGNNSDLSHSVIQASLRNMQDLLESESDSHDSVSIINSLINYLHERKIVCYSPQGRAYELPRGATALDFAYAVGPSIGNIATGANINNQKGKLGQVLAEGDTVEIEIDPTAAPQSNWLGFVATNKARKEILKGLRNLPSDIKIQHGKDSLVRALATYNKSIEELTDTDWADILTWRGVANHDELFLQIADGSLLPQLVVSRLFSDIVDNSEEDAITKTQHLLAGVKGVEVDFSSCCNPIYGDPIVGHLSKHGLTVHRHKCHSLTAIRQQNPYQVIHLSWKADTPNPKHDNSLRFPVLVRIFSELNQEKLSQVIYEMKHLNIGVDTINAKHDHHRIGTTTLSLVVRSRSHLADGIDTLRHLLGYPNIMRLYEQPKNA